MSRNMVTQPGTQICPFGPALQKYWDKRYEYFTKFDDGIQTDAQGLYSVVPEAVALQQASLIKGNVVVDGFCGVGGFAIALARQGKRVVTIEIDPTRLAMAKHNAKVYGVAHKIEFIEGDFLEVAPALQADTFVLDPPWGGLTRERTEDFLLADFTPDGQVLLGVALRQAPEILFKVPPNFAMRQLDGLALGYTVSDHYDSHDGRKVMRSVYMNRLF